MTDRLVWLYEYQAKSIYDAYAIPTPPRRLVATADEAVEAWRALGGDVMLKAQVRAGGRGKAGGIRRAIRADEARQIADRLLGGVLLGWPVQHLLVEATVPIAAECYVAILTDPARSAPLVLVSGGGGVDIEALAHDMPERLARFSVDVVDGLRPYHAYRLVVQAGLPPEARRQVVDVLLALYRLYRERDAQLVEINPLAITHKGDAVAVDARLLVDENAFFRQPEMAAWQEQSVAEARAAGVRLNYVPLDGDIGIIGTGAGMAMANMDQVAYFGGRPANFMDIGPGMTRGGARVALDILLDRPELRAILVSGYSAGPLALVAQNVVDALAQRPECHIPVVVRLQGHQDDEARSILRGCTDPRLHVAEDFDAAAELVVSLAARREAVA